MFSLFVKSFCFLGSNVLYLFRFFGLSLYPLFLARLSPASHAPWYACPLFLLELAWCFISLVARYPLALAADPTVALLLPLSITVLLSACILANRRIRCRYFLRREVVARAQVHPLFASIAFGLRTEATFGLSMVWDEILIGHLFFFRFWDFG
ncbi:hypothetical protein HDK77DRAFT_317240 [Phyllosticta capitalensis]